MLDPIAQIRQAVYDKYNQTGVESLTDAEKLIFLTSQMSEDMGKLSGSIRVFTETCPLFSLNGSSGNIKTRRDKVIQVVLPTGFGVGLLAAILQVIEAIKS